MKYTEQQMSNMASPIGKSEDEKCKNAIRMVRDAMKNLNYTDDGKDIRSFAGDTYSYSLDLRQQYSNKKITLLVQGSYANKTNIQSESDVDVAVILESTFTTKYRAGVTDSNYGFTTGTFTAKQLKDEVLDALNKHFRYRGVERHDKCIKVYGNTYRVDADVVPAYRFRDYSGEYYNDANNFIGGVEILPDKGGRIINFPEQHIKLDIKKNRTTNYNFKKCVRIIKNMREDMKLQGYIIPQNISSFGLESLLWNVEDNVFIKYASILRYTFDEVISYLKNDYMRYGIYKEANGVKMLFTDDETKKAYEKFINDLNDFYNYDI